MEMYDVWLTMFLPLFKRCEMCVCVCELGCVEVCVGVCKCVVVFGYPLPAVYIRSSIGNLSPANSIAICFFSADQSLRTVQDLTGLKTYETSLYTEIETKK